MPGDGKQLGFTVEREARLLQVAIALFLVVGMVAIIGAAAPAGRGARGGGRGTGATPAETTAEAQINAAVAAPMRALTQAREEVMTAAFALPRDDKVIAAKVEAVAAAELAVAQARAGALEAVQASAGKLTLAQVEALAGGRGGGAGAGGRGAIPHMNSNQVGMLTNLTGAQAAPLQALAAARAAVTRASLAEPRNDKVIQEKVAALGAAELALAKARADGLEKIQASPDKLAEDQVRALIAAGGVLTSGGFTEPLPMDFNDHEGYVSLFDGMSLKGWDGNPKFWRVEGGAIIGESTPQNPSGNSYIAYRDLEAKDFTLKFEIKVEGTGGSGLQYRSKTGVPWLTPIPANVTANVGPVNLQWMMTGPQADFWPSRVYTGQFYSENTPMRIMAWRGQVVEGAGMGPRRLMGAIGDRAALGERVKANEWNQYTVIARGGVFLHIVNGQLMAVMIDDDPTSTNNQAGLFGIEIEATTKIAVRNIWVKVVK